MSGAGEPRIAVVDYGMGNRRSVEKALERVGARAFVSRDHAELRAADGLLLPGVGAFPAAMTVIRDLGLDELLRERAAAGTPVFGSCMGMQLLFERSAEHGGAEGLGLLRGEVRKLETGDLKLPHIGWSEVAWQRPTPLREGLPDPTFLYHVHSFVAHPADPEVVLATAQYGETFPAVVGVGNVYGAQSHVEKSSTHGLRLLGNFVGLCAAAAAARVPTQPSGLCAPS
jgi:glutamine amidotransferase